MKIKKSKKIAEVGQVFNDSKLISIFTLILLILSIGLYYNTAFNEFSMDDGMINIENPTQAKGLAAIPEIFSTPYSSLNGNSLGYRPITRLSFALEYQFTANSKFNPLISHVISTLLYALAIFLLYGVLRRLLRNFNPWFIFIIMLFFVAHPTHTEVVASLKNRDILLNFLFSFLAIKMFVNWADFKKIKYLVYGLISFFLALLSKETAIAQLAVFPLVLYFFTDMPLKKIMLFTGGLLALIVVTLGIPALFLPSFNRIYSYFENPLAFEDNFFVVLATGFYSLGWYLKMLVFPYPLSFYYGYNMLPIVSFTNIWAILSFLVYAGMFVYAIINIKKKTFLSFVFLYFIINISMYANIVAPVPGIVGDRFMFFPSLAFIMFFVWFLFKILGVEIKGHKIKNSKLIILLTLSVIIVAPFSYYVHVRNTNWRSEYRIYNSDIGHLQNSAKANQLYGQAQLKLVNYNLAKKVNTYQFILRMIEISEEHFYQAVEIDSNMYVSWTGLGNIYSRIHGNQAKLRALSYGRKMEFEQSRQERKNMMKYFGMALEYYDNALIAKPDYDEAIFNIGNTYELMGIMDSAIIYYDKGIEIQGERVNTLSKLANVFFLNNEFDKSLQMNKRIIELDSTTSIPYVNMGNYFMKSGDTLNAISYFETAVEKGAQASVSHLLAGYYEQKRNPAKVEYYILKAYEYNKKHEK